MTSHAEYVVTPRIEHRALHVAIVLLVTACSAGQTPASSDRGVDSAGATRSVNGPRTPAPTTSAPTIPAPTTDGASSMSSMPGMETTTLTPHVKVRASGAASTSGTRPTAGMKEMPSMPGMRGNMTMSMPSAAPGTIGARSTSARGRGRDMRGMRGMSGMSGMEHMTDSAAVKLHRLITGLLRDPVVRERIQSDSILLDGWQDRGVRTILAAP
jgi:hypothetical protein